MSPSLHGWWRESESDTFLSQSEKVVFFENKFLTSPFDRRNVGNIPM